MFPLIDESVVHLSEQVNFCIYEKSELRCTSQEISNFFEIYFDPSNLLEDDDLSTQTHHI